MVSPQAKRVGVGYLMTHRKCSQRQACALVRVARSSARDQPRIDPEEARLTEHIRELATGIKSMVTCALQHCCVGRLSG
jgi:hypothetical protein